ncbi:MAG: HAD-IC family P-type ATPase [Devosia sp.]|nr:HAD-IC family P-type ATPase [Devosia sp.]
MSKSIQSQTNGAPAPNAASPDGLTAAEASARLAQYGPNALPEARAPSLVSVFLRQFLSPLIYVLLAAALVSVALGDIKDALFIGAVLLVNGVIGAAQEYSAGRAAAALRKLEPPHAIAIREGVRKEIDARELVPGDLVLMEAGVRVPADVQIVDSVDLHCDESLLTGESVPVRKGPRTAPDKEAAQSRQAFAFAGTTITRGRGRGVVFATGASTEIGRIAEEIGKRSISQPPLIIRMERFARNIAISVAIAIALLMVVGGLRGMGIRDLFMLSVGLAVSAIPEGLPVAISVALAIGMRRMAKGNVIVRKMAAVESLGSCTMIATDKTGTLTMNKLTVSDIVLPDGTKLICVPGDDLDACAIYAPQTDGEDAKARTAALLMAAALPNEADLVREPGGWRGTGDTVDVALLSVAHKGGLAHDEARERYPLLSRIPYEPDRRYAASFHRSGKRIRIFVKGAPETLIAMSDRMQMGGNTMPIDCEALRRQQNDLAVRGLRVLGFAEGDVTADPAGGLDHRHLVNLTFLGLAGMQDPLRPEVPKAVSDCRNAGIEVAMITGDDPGTASTIAAEAGLTFLPDQVVTGEDVQRAEAGGDDELDRLTRHARIYARVDPSQKLSIVLSLARGGHFVAVTGDGVNDAPALRHAHVGVAMGRTGTEVAKESADIVITDDNFASIVTGVLEGRVAYGNIRKVIFMLVSTGAAEVVLFLLAIPLGLPMPLLPVQLLWLNLVTNGMQDVALAAEKAESSELSYPPRRPKEPILDRVMVRRIWRSAVVMGVGGFAFFYWLLAQGYAEDAARNLLLMLFVLFENFQTFNSRSEHRSIFKQGFFANPLLVLSVIGAQVLHIAAMYIPGLNDTLALQPVSLVDWGVLVLLASSILVVMELDKWRARRRPSTR